LAINFLPRISNNDSQSVRGTVDPERQRFRDNRMLSNIERTGNGYFKFVDSAHIDRLLVEGTVLMRRLSHFRKLERVSGAWIGDALEARSVLTVDQYVTSPTVTAEEQKILDEFRFKDRGILKFSGGGQVSLERISFVSEIPDEYFLFCASFGELESLKEAMCSTGAIAYDACIEIAHIDLLAHHIFRQGQVVELAMQPVSTLFDEPEVGPVSYEKATKQIGQGMARPGSLFVKDSYFSSQSEVRIALRQRIPSLPETVTIKLRKPARVFREVFRLKAAGAAA
jgi:hypothetical protein